MAPRSSRRSKRRQGGGGDGTPEASQTTASSRRTRRNASPQRRQQPKNYTPWFIAGGAAIVIVLVAAIVFQVLSGAGASANFEFSVYQGEEHFGGAENVNFTELLDDGKPIVLNFWAGDCPPCRAEMPAFERVWAENKEEVLFIGLDVGVFTGLGTEDSGRALLNELGITYPAGAPPNRTPVVNYTVRSMPTTIFFGADGQIMDRADGAINEARLSSIVDRLLEGAS